MGTKQRYVGISRGTLGSRYVVPINEAPDAIDDELEDGTNTTVGTVFTLKVIEMTQEEYDALPQTPGEAGV